MSECLLTSLPVRVSGDREKMGYFMLKKALDYGNSSFTIWLAPSNSFWIRWNNNTYYSNGTKTSPNKIGEGSLNSDYHLAWSNKDGKTNEQVAAWIERQYIRAIELRAGTLIKENSGFEYLLNSFDFEFLDVDDRDVFENQNFKASALKCLRFDASGLQNYQIQEILNDCPSLIYVCFHTKGDLSSSSNSYTNNLSLVSDNSIRNVVFPDNLKYIRNAPSLIANLSANCIECVINNNTLGSVNDFVEKAIAKGRSSGEMSVRCISDTLSNNLTYTYISNDEAVTIPLVDKLSADNIPHAEGDNFYISWDSSAVTPITFSPASSQCSRNINFANYRSVDKLGPEFGITE